MVRFIHTSDWHLGKRSYRSIERYRDNFKAIAKLIEKIEEIHKQTPIDFILHAGDIFDSHNISARTLNNTIRLLTSIKELGIRLYLIRGNHDANEGDYRNTFLHVLEEVELVSLINTNRDIPPEEPQQDVKIYGIPHRYTRYDDVLREVLREFPVDNDCINIMALHASVIGLEDSDKRNNIPSAKISFTAQGIGSMDFNYVALGHHHTTAIYRSEEEEEGYAIAYSGSTEHWSHANWIKGEDNDEKFALKVEIKNGKTDVERIPFSVRPKIKVEADFSGIDPDKAIQEIQEICRKKDQEFERFVPKELQGLEKLTQEQRKEKLNSLPIIYFEFRIDFDQKDKIDSLKDLKMSFQNILYEGSRVNVISEAKDKKRVVFSDEKELYRKVISAKYPEIAEEVYTALTTSLDNYSNLSKDGLSTEKIKRELREKIWRENMREE